MKRKTGPAAGAGAVAGTDGAVRIAVRERPRMASDNQRASILSAAAAGRKDEDRRVIERAGAEEDNIIVVADRPFVFDAVLGPSVGQEQLYERLVRPMVDRLLEGFFCTVLAYGQTGTGKSYTMGMHTEIIVVADRPFVFDAVLGPSVGQEQLYERLVRPMVDRLLEGFFCTVLAYGQTGTGKSYTMGMHTEAFSDAQGGVVPRTLRDIFARVQDSNNAGHTETALAISFIEIYNEKCIDLLQLADSADAENNVTLNQTTTGSSATSATHSKHSFSAQRRPVRTLADAHRVLADGNRQRHVRPTKMNALSSRSHAICTVHASVRAANRHTASAMHLVDLAGSEGVRRTGHHQGAALAEGVHINQGLLSIGKVLQALSSGQRVVPYRDSVLSSVLQDSLSGNAYLTLLACISPLAADVSETLSTLRFANGAKSLRLTPQVNAIVAEIKKTRTPAKLKTPSKHLVPQLPQNPASPSIGGGGGGGGLGAKTTPLLARKSLFAHSTAFKAKEAQSRKLNPKQFPARTAIRSTLCTPRSVAANPTVRLVSRPTAPGSALRRQPGTAATSATVTRPSSAGGGRNDTIGTVCDDESQLFLDVSTSTVFEQPAAVAAATEAAAKEATAATAAPQSYSPLVRRCVAEVEQSMGLQIRALMQSFARDHQQQQQQQTLVAATEPDEQDTEALLSSISAVTVAGDDEEEEEEQKKLEADGRKVVETDATIVPRRQSRRSTRVQQLMGEEDGEAEAGSSDGSGGRSPRRNVANISWNTLTRGLREIVRDEITALHANTILPNSTTLLPPATGTSTIDSQPPTGIACDSTTPPFKRPALIGAAAQKRRLPARRNTVASASSAHLTSLSDTITLLAEPADPVCPDAAPLNCRRSARISIRRQTIRVDGPKSIAEELQEPIAPAQPVRIQRGRARPGQEPSKADRFVQEHGAAKGAAQKKRLQRDFVLDLFNTGTLRELQILPQVGPKLAYQIITCRSTAGRLRSVQQMAEMPIWRGKLWERFKLLNNLE